FNDALPNKGNLRETFFFNQLQVKHQVMSPKFGDFMIAETYTFEISGATKTVKQISGIPLSYIAADEIKFGSQRRLLCGCLDFFIENTWRYFFLKLLGHFTFSHHFRKACFSLSRFTG